MLINCLDIFVYIKQRNCFRVLDVFIYVDLPSDLGMIFPASSLIFFPTVSKNSCPLINSSSNFGLASLKALLILSPADLNASSIVFGVEDETSDAAYI
jgi:hypothetical protein